LHLQSNVGEIVSFEYVGQPGVVYGTNDVAFFVEDRGEVFPITIRFDALAKSNILNPTHRIQNLSTTSDDILRVFLECKDVPIRRVLQPLLDALKRPNDDKMIFLDAEHFARNDFDGN
jgi:hypothetical protein